MERLSIFDIYKIGVGPSSSHTLGPWRAAQRFMQWAGPQGLRTISIQLFGSLSKTGIGHGTDKAIQLGLLGHDPVTVRTDLIDGYLRGIRKTLSLRTRQKQVIPFDPDRDIVFQPHTHDGHPNALTISALTTSGDLLVKTYFSLGGGFIQEENATAGDVIDHGFVNDVSSGKKMTELVERRGKPLAQLLFENERCIRTEKEVRQRIHALYETMLDCTYRGCHRDGILPGGLSVQRRAAQLNRDLLRGAAYDDRAGWLAAISATKPTFANINRWISCFALAVNEENASLSRVVTSPTNGASGVIPAVLLYHRLFNAHQGEEDLLRFFLVSGQIGALFKQGATISAAVGGCQAEVGVSSAMAAAGLTEILGGTVRQVLQAAEIAMEHHLGLTCDPIGGLVQIPCIERNAMGAMKAITAAHLALSRAGERAIVSFDSVVRTMWQTAQDMDEKYKETSEAGLAVNVAEC